MQEAGVWVGRVNRCIRIVGIPASNDDGFVHAGNPGASGAGDKCYNAVYMSYNKVPLT